MKRREFLLKTGMGVAVGMSVARIESLNAPEGLTLAEQLGFKKRGQTVNPSRRRLGNVPCRECRFHQGDDGRSCHLRERYGSLPLVSGNRCLGEK